MGIYESNFKKFFSLCNSQKYAASQNISEYDHDLNRLLPVETKRYSEQNNTKFKCHKYVPVSSEFLKKKVQSATEK